MALVSRGGRAGSAGFCTLGPPDFDPPLACGTLLISFCTPRTLWLTLTSRGEYEKFHATFLGSYEGLRVYFFFFFIGISFWASLALAFCRELGIDVEGGAALVGRGRYWQVLLCSYWTRTAAVRGSTLQSACRLLLSAAPVGCSCRLLRSGPVGLASQPQPIAPHRFASLLVFVASFLQTSFISVFVLFWFATRPVPCVRFMVPCRAARSALGSPRGKINTSSRQMSVHNSITAWSANGRPEAMMCHYPGDGRRSQKFPTVSCALRPLAAGTPHSTPRLRHQCGSLTSGRKKRPPSTEPLLVWLHRGRRKLKTRNLGQPDPETKGKKIFL